MLNSTEKQKMKIISPKSLETHIYKHKKPNRVCHWRKKKISACCENMLCVASEENLDNREHLSAERGIRVKRIKVI